jgi:hypothetical protein
MTASRHRSSLTANKFRGGTIDMETPNTFGLENTPMITLVIAAYMVLVLVVQLKNVIATHYYQTRIPITVTLHISYKKYF